MVIFCVEWHKAWRILQSRAGVENQDYIAQKELLAKIDAGEMTVEEFFDWNEKGEASKKEKPSDQAV